MKKLFYVFVLSLLMTTSSFAQLNSQVTQSNTHFECGVTPEMEQEITDPPPPSSAQCFHINNVQTNCTIVYLKVNMHFFLDNNCEGDIATAGVQGNLSPQNAFQIADDMITDANNFLEGMSNNGHGQWFPSQHGAVPTSPQCVPIRYVLSGVEIHCDTDAQSTGINFSDFNNHITNGTSEINIYLSNVAGGPNGFAPLSTTDNRVVIETFGAAALNHEMGHVFDLLHVFRDGGDFCDDTWDSSWAWDSDGDGMIDQTGSACWTNDPDADELMQNGQSVCDETLFDPTHPCCEVTNQNNNLMTYSGFAVNRIYSALTPCQIRRMLDDIAANMCDYVAAVGGDCPPVKANIGVLPTVDQSTACPTCFYLNTSFNESQYSIVIVDENDNVMVNTGLIPGEAKKYCIPRKVTGEWTNGFEAFKTYTLAVTVENECGDNDTEKITFTLPKPCDLKGEEAPSPDDDHFKILKMSPNPGTGHVKVEYNLKSGGKLNIYGAHVGSLNEYGLVAQYELQQGENQELTINTGSWYNGINSIVFEFKGEIHIENFIKQ